MTICLRRRFPLLGTRAMTLIRTVCLIIFLTQAYDSHADQFDVLRNYWLNQLTGTNLSGSIITSRASTASNYLATMNTGPSRTNLWSDVPLGSISANVTTHFSRLQAMALAWATPGCSLQGNASLASAVTNGLDWMCANSYTTIATEYNNWWDWEIGGLQNFNNAAVLIYPALSAVQITNYNNSVDHFCPGAQGWMTGANLADKCKGMIVRGILGKSSAKLATAQTNLSPVFLYVTSGDGFYRDGSFVQHTRIAYTGTYGIVLLGDVAQLVNLLNGSTWQITDPNLTNVYNWVVNSYQPVIYKGAMMDMVRGRAIARYSETESGDGSSAINAIKQIAQFAPTNIASAFTNWVASPSLRPGQYHFPGMDRVVAWRSNFCFGLSLSSTRIANYESINGENLHGWFTGDGMTYLYLGNFETQFSSDFWPTVDAYHLPGTTAETVARADAARQATASSQNWVGGAQVAGSYGAAGMSLAATNSLVAKKSWFMFDNQVVCLGAGITCGDVTEVDTTVENRRLGTSPTNILSVNGTSFSPTIGWSSNLTSVSWCALGGVAGYYFPGGATNLRAAFVANTGSWSQINNGTYVGTTTNLFTDNYLTLWFNHGFKPTNSTYAYVILPHYTASSMATYAASPEILILTNTATVQAAAKPASGLVGANFWVDGTNSADLITVNKKSSVMVLENSGGVLVGIADPTQTNNGSIKVTLNRAAISTISADAGVTVLQLSPQIVLSVNLNGSLGKSFQAAFLYPAPTATWDANPGLAGAQDGSGTWNNSNTNWWAGSTDMAWNDASPYVAAFGASGAAGTVALSNPHTAFALAFNPLASGSYLLLGVGALTVNNGITANASATLNVPLSLGTNQTWTVATNQTLSLGGTVSAPSPVALSFAGAGVVNFTGTNQISMNIASLNFVDALNKTTLSVSGGVETIGDLNLKDGVSSAITGGGTLAVNAVVDFRIGGETSGATQSLDLSALNAFIYYAPTNAFSAGGQSSGVTANGTIYLAATSSITANALNVQNVTGSTTTQSSGNLYLGRNTTINANDISVGLTRDNGAIKFESGIGNPTLRIRATDGLGRANLTIGTRGSSYFSAATALVDLTNNISGVSTLDVLITRLEIANEGYCLAASDLLDGNFIMGSGTLDVTTMTIGLKSSLVSQSLGVVNGNFTQGGGLVNARTLALGDRIAGNTNTLNATYNLNGGALMAQLITPGANAATRNLNWNNGTIGNYDASTDLAIAAGLNLILSPSGLETFSIGNGRIGLVNSIISGAGGLVASGGGSLILAASNTYSGTTTVSSGSLLVNGVIGTNAVAVLPNAALGGSGNIGGVVTVRAGAKIQPGNALGSGTLKVGTLNLGDAVGATTYSFFSIAAGGQIATSTLNLNGTNIINILDSNLAAGTNTLITYSGAIGGGGFAGFKLGTIPSGVTTVLKNTGSAIQLVVTPLVAPILSATTYAAGGFSLSFSGSSGQSYRVLASTNLSIPMANWLVLTNGIFGAGPIDFTDFTATNVQKYYRISSP